MPRFTLRDVFLALTLLAVGTAGVVLWLRYRDARNYDRASDASVFWTERVKAASQLSEIDRARLRNELMSQLPGDWDAATSDTVTVLAEVGNEETAQLLESIYQLKIERVGKLNTVILLAIKQIQSRPQR